MIFDTSDGLKVLFRSHTEAVVLDLLRAMRPRQVLPGEMLLQQGISSDSLFVVDEGRFDLMVRGNRGSLQSICEYGPGAVFGELGLVSRSPRTASVVAATAGRVWVLGRASYLSIARVTEDRTALPRTGDVASIPAPGYEAPEFQKLRTILDSSDGLKVLLREPAAPSVEEVLRGLRPRHVLPGHVLVQQGASSEGLFVVDEGRFEVAVRNSRGAIQRVCDYGPGMVFGQHGLVSREPRAASVVAMTAGRVWVLGRANFPCSKTIGTVGSLALLLGSLTNSSLLSMPGCAQEAGWLPFVLAHFAAAAMAFACGAFTLQAMRCMPGNSNFERRIEFTNLMMFYLPKELCSLFIIFFHLHMALWVAHFVIQAGRIVGAIMLNSFGCSPGLDGCAVPRKGVDSTSGLSLLPTPLLVIGAVCGPFATRHLGASVPLQLLALAGLTLLAFLWMGVAVSSADFPRRLPVVGSSPTFVIGASLLNFGIAGMLPTWANEKRPEVPGREVVLGAVGAAAAVYTLVGVLGALALAPGRGFAATLAAKDALAPRASAIAGPLLLSLASVPVGCILIRCNLVQSGMRHEKAAVASILGPLALAAMLYDGSMAPLLEPLGLAAAAAVNYVAPLVLLRALGARRDRAAAPAARRSRGADAAG